MYLAVNKSYNKDKTKVNYDCMLRESYRVGKSVKKKTIAYLGRLDLDIINAIKLALKCKGNLMELASVEDIKLKEGLSVGAVCLLHEIAKRKGIVNALGKGRNVRLALVQIIARAIGQGSRLSAIRMAKTHAFCDVIGFEKGFHEGDLYENLGWIAENQEKIEKRLLSGRCGDKKPDLFLYDVTSSYLEGKHNELAAYGYNRDKKKGKMQIVIGMLCDKDGEPLSTEVFTGNTNDLATFKSQVDKAKETYGCERVTFVGDRGMIKSGQIEGLQRAGFNFITAITKCQIKTMLKTGVFQLGLFDEEICEVKHNGNRYVLRRNPIRADEIAQTRQSKLQTLQELIGKKNEYLKNHQRAKVETAEKAVNQKLDSLFGDGWLKIEAMDRNLKIIIDNDALEEESRLDGCYALKTDLSADLIDIATIHSRYKDLAMVEQAFRTCKQNHLKVRPIYVRNEKHTRGHVFVTMLAYILIRELRKLWGNLDVTVQEGLNALSTLTTIEMKIGGKCHSHRIPEPRNNSKLLLDAAGVKLPKILPDRGCRVDTKRKKNK